MAITRRNGPVSAGGLMLQSDAMPMGGPLGGPATDTATSVNPTLNSDTSRSRETPRDRAPQAPPTLAQAPSPAPPSGAQDTNATPTQPMQPTPVAAGPPQPFTPMQTAVTQQASTQPGGLASIMRRGIEPSPQGGTLLGHAGGMLGGGLGVPGLGGGGGGDDLSALLASIFKMAAGGPR